jgi:hypothetical protein
LENWTFEYFDASGREHVGTQRARPQYASSFGRLTSQAFAMRLAFVHDILSMLGEAKAVCNSRQITLSQAAGMRRVDNIAEKDNPPPHLQF